MRRAVAHAEQEAAAASLRDADALLGQARWVTAGGRCRLLADTLRFALGPPQIASGVPVDVMPGDREPSNHALPQLPLHPCLLPAATRFSSLRPVTNPYDAEVRAFGARGCTPSTPPCRSCCCSSQVGGVRVLGHSGQPVADVLRYSSSCYALSPGAALADIQRRRPGGGADAVAATGEGGAAPPPPTELDALSNTLLWRHLAPTAPDTLTCYPFYDVDPFVIDDAHVPHLLFSGGARAFGSQWIGGDAADGSAGGVRAVTVPAFWATHTAVLVNLRSATLDAEAITFAFGPGKPESRAGQLPPGLLL